MALTVLKYCQDARKELQLLESRIKEAFMYHVDPLLPLKLFIFPNKLSPTGIIAQENKPLEWIYLHHKDQGILTFLTFSCSTNKSGKTRCKQLYRFCL